jgi:hypothetical protein
MITARFCGCVGAWVGLLGARGLRWGALGGAYGLVFEVSRPLGLGMTKGGRWSQDWLEPAASAVRSVALVRF